MKKLSESSDRKGSSLGVTVLGIVRLAFGDLPDAKGKVCFSSPAKPLVCNKTP
jgi:hypothetical protein